MYLSPDELNRLQNIIKRLYAGPFNEALVREVFQCFSQMINVQYSCFGFFSDSVCINPSNMITNRSSEFMENYYPVASQDFLMKSMIGVGENYVMSRSKEYVAKENREFVHTVQSTRPISDMLYSPIKINNVICGYWGLGIVSGKGPYFPKVRYVDLALSQKQLEIFSFLKSFLDDALERAFFPVEIDNDTAYLDYQGNILKAGDQIRDTFSSIFGKRKKLDPKILQRDERRLFFQAYRAFLNGPVFPGMDRFNLRGEIKKHTFLFRRLNENGVSIKLTGVPFASVSLIDEPLSSMGHLIYDRQTLSKRFCFSSRECDVIQGILQGKSNKRIARDLFIDESTVKRHTHNIYEKSGFSSRVELVMGLLH